MEKGINNNLNKNLRNSLLLSLPLLDNSLGGFDNK